MDARPNLKERLEELRTKWDFTSVELECFEANHGEISMALLSSFEGFLQSLKEKRMPKKQLHRLARPLTAGDLKRPMQITTPVSKRREVGEADAGTPNPLPKPKSHKITTKSSTGTSEKALQRPSGAAVKMLGECFWRGEEGHSAYTWMDESIADRAYRRDERLQEWEPLITAALQTRHEAAVGIVGVPSQVETILCGRICCEGLEGRLNENSLLLEGSTLAGGAKVQLNVGHCQQVTAFPGQIVGVVGTSGLTGTFHAKELLPGLAPPRANPLPSSASLHALMVAGPFSPKDSLDFSAFDSLLADLAQSRPEVLIIFGPLLDSNNSKVAAGEVHRLNGEEPCGFEEVYEEVLALLARRLLPLRRSEPPTEVLIVPSLEEVVSFHPLPQPPLDVSLGAFLRRKDSLEELRRMGVKFLPNPAHVEINGIKVSLTTADALTPLLKDLVVKPSGRKMDQALGLLMQQRCLFPMVPREPAQVCEAKARSLDFSCAPELCIFPSVAGLNATLAEGALFVNPGFLYRNGALGSFGELWITAGPRQLSERFRFDTKKLHANESGEAKDQDSQ